MSTKEGFSWTKQAGLNPGLPCIGAVIPPRNHIPSRHDVLDVIVIGAGYAGLVAARDLVTQGKRTLLIEARDRLGGRTWHSTLDGFNYEMGGTWIHWQMPHIYREVSFYGLHGDWIVSQQPGGKLNYHSVIAGNERTDMPHSEEDKMFGKVWGTFCNVDGTYAKETMPYPFDSMRNREAVNELDKLTCLDRLNQIRHQFSATEIAMLEALLLQMGGGPLDKMGLLDALRWWALGGHTGTGLNDIALSTRLRSGQSELHRRIFDHSVSTGRLSYAFSTPVVRIEDNRRHGIVTVTARTGESWRARKVICTIPLNVLEDISFSPALPTLVQQAIREGQVNHCNKFHLDTAGPDLLSWSSFSSPGKGAICALADHLTPAGDTHLVAFGPNPNSPNGIHLANNVEGIKKAAEHLLPKGQVIKRIVYHDWNQDEFAKGTWCYLPPGFASRYLDILQKPHGNVLLASADWSDGWRGWIDGAVQAGIEAAKFVVEEQKKDEERQQEGSSNVASRL